MTHIDDDGTAPMPPGRDGSDAALDAAFSAANAGMVAAIRRGFDLDAGLARIIGAPPEAEIGSPGSPAENTWNWLLSFSARPNGDRQQLDPYICTVDVGTQIARLRFRVLDHMRNSQVDGSATVLLRTAASNLQDLHRGLEGKALSRQAAGNLIDVAGLALETASDVEASGVASPGKEQLGEDSDYFARCTTARNPLLSEQRILRRRRSRLAGAALLVMGTALLTLAVVLSLLGVGWLRGLLVTLDLKNYGAAEAAVVAVNVAILGLLVFRVPRRIFRMFRRRSERVSALTDAIKARAALRRQAADVGKAAAVLRRSVQPGDRERSDALTYVALLHAVAKQQRPTADAATSRIDVLREELDSLRPNVMKLFDGADDCSPCTPR
jgi:hypothetical protein